LILLVACAGAAVVGPLPGWHNSVHPTNNIFTTSNSTSLMYALAALNLPNFKQLYKITSSLLEVSKCVAFDEKET